MSAVLLPNGKQQYTTATGAPLVGGKVFTYDTGTTTPRTTWADAAQVAPNANPVILDARGEAPIFWSGAYRVVIQDALGNAVWTMDGISDLSYGAGLRADLASFTDGAKGAGLVGYSATVSYGVNTVGSFLDSIYSRNAAEVAAAAVPVNLFYPPYNRSRYSTWANWKAACDQADEEGLVNGNWVLTADIELPHKCKFTGALTGAFTVLYQNRDNGWVTGLSCVNVSIRGIRFCAIENLYCTGNVTIDGFDITRGTFWNDFLQWRVEGTMTISITNWAVNENTWLGGRADTTLITGNQATYGATQAHANEFIGFDFTDGGILQNDTAFEVNFIRGGYYEGGANIVGNFHIWGYQGDANGMPGIARFAHIMGAVGRNPRLWSDFLSMTVHNAVRGGNWDWTDTSNKPPGISQTGGGSPAVVVDVTEPGGMGKRYEASFSGAFSGHTILIQPNGTDRFGVHCYYKSTADYAACESNDGSGPTNHSLTPVVVDAANNWKMLRISGPASKTATTIVTLFAYQGVGGAAKVMSLGGVFGGGERAVTAPHKNQDFESGIYTPALTNGANMAASVAYPMQYFRVGNVVTVSGRVDVDPTAAGGVATVLNISLPIAPYTAFTLAQQLAGVFSASSVTESGAVLADPVGQRAEVRFNAISAASHDAWLQFSYRMS